MKRDFAQTNAELAVEVSRYIRTHKEFARKIPRGAQIVIQVDGDEEFNRWSRRIAEGQRREGQPCVFITVEKVEPVRSRIDRARIERAAA